MNKNFIFAVSNLIGAIVGLGMFGIPYTASKAGFFVGTGYIIFLGALMLILHLIIGEIVERTSGKHRLTGFVEKYLGIRWKKIIGGAIVFSIYAALLAYIVVGGQFLSLLFPNFLNAFWFSLIFWFVLSMAVWRGMRTIGQIEFLMTALLLLFVFILFGRGVLSIDADNFSGFNLFNFILPYGVVLFALDGTFAIPEIQEFFGGDRKKYKGAIIAGSLIPVFLYLLFTTVVVGVSGNMTSEESLRGLAPYLGDGATRLGAIFGVLGILTSYLVLGSNLKHTFAYDWRMKGGLSALLVTFVPILIYLTGIQQFIEVIAFSGAVIGAVIGSFVIFVYIKAVKHGDKEPSYRLNLPRFVLFGIMALLVFGGVYEIIYLIF